MEQKSKWRVFWEQISGNLDFVGTWLIGAAMLVTGFAGDLLMATKINWVGFGLKGAGVLIFIICTVIYLRRIYRTSVWMVTPKHIPVIFAIGATKDKVNETLQKVKDTVTKETGFKDFKAFEKYFGEWSNLLYEAQWQIGRFTCRIPGDKIYHIFILGPASLAIGFGAIMGVKHRIVVYQYLDNEYKPVLDLSGADIRRIKEAISGDLRYFNFQPPAETSSNTALLLALASHFVEEDARSYITSNNIAGSIVTVRNTYAGNLKELDWTGAVQELFSVFTRLKSVGRLDCIHLLHGIPVALAFGLGMALGTFVHIMVYNWETKESKYYPVLELNKLPSIL
jgi:hypothetical protein